MHQLHNELAPDERADVFRVRPQDALFSGHLRAQHAPKRARQIAFSQSASLQSPRDRQGTFVPCEARILWYAADRTSSRKLRNTT